MRQILHASFWKFSKLSNSGISLNWSTNDEVTTCNTTAYFFGSLCIYLNVAQGIMHHLYNVARGIMHHLILFNDTDGGPKK